MMRSWVGLLLILSTGSGLLSGTRSPRLTDFATSSPLFTPAHFRRSSTALGVMAPLRPKKKQVRVTNTNPDDEDVVNGDVVLDVNGKHNHGHDVAMDSAHNPTGASEDQVQQNKQAAEDVLDLMNEISERMENGSKEMLGDLNDVMEEKLERLPEDSANEFANYITELTETIQAAQQRELERQLSVIEAKFVKPLEQFVFSDAAIYDGGNSEAPREERKEQRSKLVLAGANSTLSASRRLRTKEIIKNINVAPFYYSVALLSRWFRKVGYPPIALLTALRSMASIVKPPNIRSKSRKKGDAFLKDAEMMQAGWKRTGEIAAKGPLARKWAVMRRSAEIWAYFSSFYMKERRFDSKHKSGKWSTERLSEERSKLGAEITQNLLKLGPTFIKV